MSKKNENEVEKTGKETNIINKNSEILFIYDASKCNPNGDFDDENQPRMDKETNTNLVSDVRLKRYIRDYLKLFKDQDLWVDNDAKNAKEKTKSLKDKGKKPSELIDAKFFGGVFIEEEKLGSESALTGPVQFNWGYSLNKVELLDSKTISSIWTDQKGVGKDYRVKYSLIAFSGSINAKIADKNNNLTNDELKLLDESILFSIPLLRTRSKINQYPRLYMRIELNSKSHFLKDLREYISLKKEEGLNGIKDVQLDVSKLMAYLETNKDKISKIYLFLDENLKCLSKDEEISLITELKRLFNETKVIDLSKIGNNN